MTAWSVLFVALLAAIACTAVVCVRADPPSGVIALAAAGGVTTFALLLLALIGGQPYLYDVAIVFAVLSFTGSLVFLHHMDAL